MSAPTGKWGNARRQFLSHRSFSPFDPEGQGGGARHREKRNRLFLPLLFILHIKTPYLVEGYGVLLVLS